MRHLTGSLGYQDVDPMRSEAGYSLSSCRPKSTRETNTFQAVDWGDRSFSESRGTAVALRQEVVHGVPTTRTGWMGHIGNADAPED